MSDPRGRVEALRAYNILDTPPEQQFDDLTRLTSQICGTPIALVSLLDYDRQWFKSKVGLSVSETPIEQAFCSHAIEQENVFLVPDATLDDRFAHNPLVTGEPNIRFYAGAPLRNPDGVALGTLCAIDQRPREFTKDQEDALAALARHVINSLELRKSVRELRSALAEKEAALREVTALQELIPMCAWCRQVRDDESFWHSVEDYLAKSSGVRLTHGICPDCAEKLSDEIDSKFPDASLEPPCSSPEELLQGSTSETP